MSLTRRLRKIAILGQPPRPADFIQSYYQTKIDADLCVACGECVDRCPMDAIEGGEDASETIDGRCIGCGLCVSTCPEEAISLVAKPGTTAPPKNYWDTLIKVKTERESLATVQQ